MYTAATHNQYSNMPVASLSAPSNNQPSPNSRRRASHSMTVATAPQSSLPPSMPSIAQHQEAGPSHNRGVIAAPTPSNDVYAHPAALAYAAAHPKRKIPQFGPYLLLQTLGEGEFGKVKLGLHSEWGEEVAVKLIRRQSVDSSARMTKVEREIEVLRLIRHPNIVRLYDVIETDKFIGIVLEYASGGELFDHILAHRYLKERDASKLFAQLISGVWYCHKKKIVHRDLKLENLLLDRNRNVIITDFGFANHFEGKENDLMQTSCGSPCYAAPELVISEGLYVGSAVDVWSCGVILYAMLAGYLPFDDDPNNPDGDNINLLYKYIVNTPLTFPEYVSQEARNLLGIMLVPDPQRRATLEQVMAHSWLGAWAHLFRQSVREVEHMAAAQQQDKRAAYQRQMRERAMQAAAQANAQRGEDEDSMLVDPLSKPGSGSAPPASTGQGAFQNEQYQQPLYSTSPVRARPVTTSITLPTTLSNFHGESNGRQPAPASHPHAQQQNTNDFPFTSDYNMGGASGSPAGTPVTGYTADSSRSRKESTRSRSSNKQRVAIPPMGASQSSAPSAGASPISPSRGPSGAPQPTSSVASPEKKRRPGGGQRHTIQLEYDGGYTSAGSGPPNLNQSTPRASGERTPTLSSSAMAGPPVTAANAQAALAKKKPGRPDSDGLDMVNYDPFTTEPIPKDLFYEPSPAAIDAILRQEQEKEKEKESERQPTGSTTPAASNTTISSSTGSPYVNIAPSTPKSVGRAGGAGYRSPSTPTPVSPSVLAAANTPRSTAGVKSPTTSNLADMAVATNLSASSSIPPSRENSQRHRRGMSMDKFGLSKLLGSGNDQQQTSPPPVSPSASAAAAVQQTQSQVSARGVRESPSGDSGVSERERTKPPTTGKVSGALPSLKNRLSGRLSRKQSADVTSVGSDKSAKEKENLQQIMHQQHIQQQQKVEEDGTKKRRKTLSLMIDPLNKTLGKGIRKGTKMAETPTVAKSPVPSSVLSPIEQPTPSQVLAASPASTPVPAPNSVRPPPSAFPGTLPNRQQGISTGKAKKVMDWFRKKSLVDSEEVSLASSTTGPAPQVVVTGDRDHTNGPATAQVAPSAAWPGSQQQPQAPQAITNGAHLLHPPPPTTVPRTASASAASTPTATSRPNIPAPSSFNRNALRVHEGAVDPGAVSSGSPDHVYARVMEALRSMGVDITAETLYKAQCVRPMKKKEGRQSGLAAFSITGLGGSSGTDRRGLPIPGHNSLTGSAGAIKGYLFRRGSSQAPTPTIRSGSTTLHNGEGSSDFSPFSPTTPEASNSVNHSTDSLNNSPAPAIPVEPIYGKRSEDKGGEVQFSVELTRIEGLLDVFHLDIRRGKGDLKSYQFIYHKIKERCDFKR